MKTQLSVFFLFLSCFSLKAQVEQGPFTFSTSITGDFISNFAGGTARGSSYVGKVDLSLQFNTQKAGLWKGGEFVIHGINAHGGLPSSRYIGDIQPVSRIEASGRTGLFEFFYRQQLGKFSFLVGQHDMNSAFAVNRYGGNFLNTSFGMYPSMALNVPLSIYPAGAACILLKWKHSRNITLQTAIYDGAPLGLEKNPHNIKWEMTASKAAFSTGEIHYQYINEEVVTGNYKIGGFYHNGTFSNLADSAARTGNYGIYLTADQMIVPRSTDKTRGLGAFLQIGSAPGGQNLVRMYMSSGVCYKGLFATRSEDNLGLALVHSSINKELAAAYPDRFLSHRTLLELTYRAHFGNHFTLQPDLQYIINPGANPSLKNAFLGNLRMALHY